MEGLWVIMIIVCSSGLIAQEDCTVIAGERERRSFLAGPVGEMSADVCHHFRYIFRGFFQNNGSGVEPCDFQQILHQGSDPFQFLFGKGGKFFYGGLTLCFFLISPL